MNFIKKVFHGETDELVHLQFQKFSRGEFTNRAMIKAKNSKNNYTISTSSEFANEFVRLCAEKLGNNKASVKGALISTLDLGKEIDFQTKKQFMGIKQYALDKQMSGNEILNLLSKFPRVFFALSFKGKDFELKIKPKAPKSAKPSTKTEEKPKIDFCKLTTNDKNIAKDFVFETENFKVAEINHDFIIEELILPSNEKDFAKMREDAKRKGKIIRKAIIDGKEMKSEKGFSV